MNAPHLVTLVRADAKFEKGVLVGNLTTTNQEVIGKSRDTTGCAMVNSP